MAVRRGEKIEVKGGRREDRKEATEGPEAGKRC